MNFSKLTVTNSKHDHQFQITDKPNAANWNLLKFYLNKVIYIGSHPILGFLGPRQLKSPPNINCSAVNRIVKKRKRKMSL